VALGKELSFSKDRTSGFCSPRQDDRLILFNGGNMVAWFALYVKARHEKVVATMLRMKGFETCLPLVRSRREWVDRDKWVDLPAFPGYLFCEFDSERRSPIASTSGVVSVVGAGKSPLAIEPDEITRLKALERTNPVVEPWPYMAVGQEVRIEGGPLDGVTGFLLDCRKVTRVVASVSLLQRSVAVEVDRARVVPVVRQKAASQFASPSWPDREATDRMERIRRVG
jgi:transcriptional antiterminator NusG